MINAETLMMVGGVCAFVLTIHWVRRRNLRERYAIGWLVTAGMLLLCGLFPQLIMGFAEAAHLSYSAAVLFISLAAIYCFSFIVSVSLTRQHRRTVRVMQETAILKQQLLAIEARLAQVGGAAPRVVPGRGEREPQ